MGQRWTEEIVSHPGWWCLKRKVIGWSVIRWSPFTCIGRLWWMELVFPVQFPIVPIDERILWRRWVLFQNLRFRFLGEDRHRGWGQKWWKLMVGLLWGAKHLKMNKVSDEIKLSYKYRIPIELQNSQFLQKKSRGEDFARKFRAGEVRNFWRAIIRTVGTLCIN